MQEDGEEPSFSIQDFTTVSPFERLVKILQKQLRNWNLIEAWKQPDDGQSIKLNSILTIAELDAGLVVRLSATRLKLRPKSPFYSKASKYQRWFGLREYIALEIISDPRTVKLTRLRPDNSNTILNALLIAMQCGDVPDYMAAFLCRDGGGGLDDHMGYRLTEKRKEIEFVSIGDKNGGVRLIHSLFEYLRDSEIDESARALSGIAAKDIHLAAIVLLYSTHKRLELNAMNNPKIHLRWVHVYEPWPIFSEILTATSLNHYIKSLSPASLLEIMPIKSLHIFFTWCTNLWSYASIKSLPLITKRIEPMRPEYKVSIKPMFCLDYLPLTSALEKLCGVSLDRAAQQESNKITPFQSIQLNNPDLSPGEQLVNAIVRLLDDVVSLPDFVSGILTSIYTAIETAVSIISLEKLMELEIARPVRISRFHLARCLDVLINIAMKKSLRNHYYSHKKIGFPQQQFLRLYLIPTPCFPQRSGVIVEVLKQAAAVKDQSPKIHNQVTESDFKLYESFVRGAILANLLDQAFCFDNYYKIWREVYGVTTCSEMAARHIPDDVIDPHDQELGEFRILEQVQAHTTKVRLLWETAKEIAKERHPVYADIEYLFPDEEFDARIAIDTIESMERELTKRKTNYPESDLVEEAMTQISFHGCHALWKTLQKTIGCSGKLILSRPLSKTLGRKRCSALIYWDKNEHTILDVAKVTPTEGLKIAEIFSEVETVAYISGTLNMKIHGFHMVREIRRVLEGFDIWGDELEISSHSGLDCVMEVIGKGSDLLSSMKQYWPVDGNSTVGPFLKELVWEDELYCSWQEEELRIAWQDEKNL